MIFRRSLFYLVFFWLTPPAQAGLILEIDSRIDLAGVKKLVAQDDDLAVETRRGTATIALPRNALPLIAQWATQYAGGPLVYSVELAGVSSLSNTYFSPNTPPGLVDAMFAYDVYHSVFSCGVLPEPEELHPLVGQHSDHRAFPPARRVSLLDPENGSPQAIWYRRLAQRYAHEPTCYAGQLTLSVRPSESGLPVRLDVKSHRYVVVQSWNRRIESLSEADRTAAELPYEPLKQHVESRWEDYRGAFPPFEEVSAIAEALAILYHAYTGHTALWEGFVETLFDRRSYLKPQTVSASRSPMLRYEPTAESRTGIDPGRAWTEIGRQTLSKGLRSTAHAELAMAWYAENRLDGAEPIVLQIEEWVEEHVAQLPTWYLAQAVGSTDLDDALVDLFEGFFEVIREQDFVRGRLDGLRLFEELVAQVGFSWDDTAQNEVPVAERLWGRIAEEREWALRDFSQQAEAFCRATEYDGTDLDLTLWERLTRDVYLTQLMDLASSEGELDPEIARLVACIHHRRALAPHVGRDVFYRHAHFRFLGYLAERRPDDHELAELVHGYQADIAERLGMGAWKEDARLAYYEPRSNSREGESTTIAFNDPVHELHGLLIPTACLATPGDRPCTVVGRGDPMAVVSPKGNVTVLLLDSRIPALRCAGSSRAGTPVRIRGLALDQGRSFVPYQMETRCSETWNAIEVPHSGMTRSEP